MKVLQINAVAGIGSTGRNVSELADGLARRGIEARVAYAEGPEFQGGYRVGTLLERSTHALLSRLSGRQAYFSRRGTQGLLQYIREVAPDVVHLHNLHANFVNLPMLLGYLAERDIATVVTLHDCWFYTGRCCHYTADGCSRWLSGCGSCPRLKKDNPSWFFDRSAEMWEDKRRLLGAIPRLAVIGVSEWITGEARQSLLSDAAIVQRIYNWVDLSLFRPQQVSLQHASTDKGPFAMLVVASKWSDAKGLGDLIGLARLVDDRTPGGGSELSHGSRHMEIRVVGEVPHGIAWPRSIKTIGPLSDPVALAREYAKADVFLQLSKEETFGKVAAEALASGKPVVAFDATANPELVGEGCGYVVASGDVIAMLAAVDEVERAGRNGFTEKCREFAVTRFGKEERIEDHVALYQRLCGLTEHR